MKRGERQNDKIHDFLNSRTVGQAANQRIPLQKRQPAAGRVVESRKRESDEEVQEDAQNVGRCASLESLTSQQARGDRQGNVPSKQDAGLGQV